MQQRGLRGVIFSRIQHSPPCGAGDLEWGPGLMGKDSAAARLPGPHMPSDPAQPPLRQPFLNTPLSLHSRSWEWETPKPRTSSGIPPAPIPAKQPSCFISHHPHPCQVVSTWSSVALPGQCPTSPSHPPRPPPPTCWGLPQGQTHPSLWRIKHPKRPFPDPGQSQHRPLGGAQGTARTWLPGTCRTSLRRSAGQLVPRQPPGSMRMAHCRVRVLKAQGVPI